MPSKYLNMLYAKSKPEETIKEHTDELLKRIPAIKKEFDDDFFKKVSIDKDQFWKMLEIVATYHDVRKSIYSISKCNTKINW